MPEEETKLKTVRVANVKAGQEFNFSGVMVKLLELNPLKHPWGKTTYILSYKLIDTRPRPIFTSQVAHLFLDDSSNVTAEMKKAVDLYEQQRETLFGIKLPVVEEN